MLYVKNEDIVADHDVFFMAGTETGDLVAMRVIVDDINKYPSDPKGM
jgi:hypothetical protein